MKWNWAARLYTFLAGRRILLAGAVLIVLTGSFLAAAALKLDKSLKALMPDTSASLRQSVELLDLAPFSRVMLIQLTAEEAEVIPRLAEAADNLVGGLNSRWARPVETSQMPDLKSIMALLPALCDESCLARLQDAAARP